MWTFESPDTPVSWTAVESPVSTTFHAVVRTANGPCAVGTDGHVVGRASDGAWGVVVESGIDAESRAVYDAAPTDDGTRLWLAGAGGSFGYYDLTSGERRDLSNPTGTTSALRSIAVAGTRGAEKLLVADGSGNVLSGEVTGDDPLWGPTTRPADGNAVTDLVADAAGVGYGVDANANVWVTTPEDGWERVGIDGEGTSLYAVATADDGLLAGGGNGRVHVDAVHPRPVDRLRAGGRRRPDARRWGKRDRLRSRVRRRLAFGRLARKRDDQRGLSRRSGGSGRLRRDDSGVHCGRRRRYGRQRFLSRSRSDPGESPSTRASPGELPPGGRSTNGTGCRGDRPTRPPERKAASRRRRTPGGAAGDPER
jgi:hypothetical protein